MRFTPRKALAVFAALLVCAGGVASAATLATSSQSEQFTLPAVTVADQAVTNADGSTFTLPGFTIPSRVAQADVPVPTVTDTVTVTTGTTTTGTTTTTSTTGTTTTTPTAMTANEWVAPNGSNTGANCVRFATAVANPDPTGASDCATMSHVGSSVAQLGDTVGVMDGQYPTEHFTTSPTAGTGTLNFVAVDPGQATFSGDGSTTTCTGSSTSMYCVEGASNLTFEGINFGVYSVGGGLRVQNGSSTTLGSQNINVDNSTMRDVLFVGILKNLSVTNSFIGAPLGQPLETGVPAVQRYNGTDPGPDTVTFDRDTFENIGSTTAGDHTECLHVWGQASNVNVLNSKFIACGKNAQATADLNYQAEGSSNRIENNFFDLNNTYAVLLGCGGGTAGQNTLFDYNSSRGPFYWGGACPAGNGNVVRGNYMPYNVSGCDSNVTYDRNVWQSAGGTSTCSANDTAVTTLDFVDAANMDLHLVNGANAVGMGSSTYPATDIDGQSRPMGTAADAGADEHA